jgi:hypothetical protein
LIHGKIAMMREQRITLGEMRSDNGPRRLIVYCSNFECSHQVVVDADCWPDSLRLSEIEARSVCQVCGRRGADVRPLFEKAGMGTG